MTDEKDISNLTLRKKRPSDVLPEGKESNSSEAIDQFYLTLAEIFNDFRGIILFLQFLEGHRRPEIEEVSSHAGDYNGLRTQLLKILISYFYEVIQFLDENRSMLNHDKLVMHLHEISDRDQYTWKQLLAFADIPCDVELTDEGQKLVQFFRRVRNNAGYHYSQSGKKLAEGFRYHFYKKDKPPNKQNQFAYYSSVRSDFYAIRYYYADAAVNGYITKDAQGIGDGNIEDIIKAVYNYTIETSHVISRLLELYLKEKPNI